MAANAKTNRTQLMTRANRLAGIARKAGAAREAGRGKLYKALADEAGALHEWSLAFNDPQFSIALTEFADAALAHLVPAPATPVAAGTRTGAGGAGEPSRGMPPDPEED